MSRSVIVAGTRTAIGKLSGAFASLSAQDLGGAAIKGVLDRTGVDPSSVDLVLMGQVLQAGQGQITARQAAVKGGIPMTVHATTVNKVCLSGLQTIYLADLMIRAGEADVIIAGGMESMTNAPYLLPGARSGYRLGDQKVVDSMMFDGLTCAFDQCAMGLSTERYNQGRISRERQDEFSARSHQLAAAAIAAGKFAEEIVAVAVPQRKGDPIMISIDEGVRGETARSPPATPPRSPTAARRSWSCRPSVANNSASRPWANSSVTARSPAPTPHFSPSLRTPSFRRQKRRTSTSRVWTSSRSTRRSRPSASPRWTISASTKPRST
jgi:acetyl-CoA acetyltransferase